MNKRIVFLLKNEGILHRPHQRFPRMSSIAEFVEPSVNFNFTLNQACSFIATDLHHNILMFPFIFESEIGHR